MVRSSVCVSARARAIVPNRILFYLLSSLNYKRKKIVPTPKTKNYNVDVFCLVVFGLYLSIIWIAELPPVPAPAAISNGTVTSTRPQTRVDTTTTATSKIRDQSESTYNGKDLISQPSTILIRYENMMMMMIIFQIFWFSLQSAFRLILGGALKYMAPIKRSRFPGRENIFPHVWLYNNRRLVDYLPGSQELFRGSLFSLKNKKIKYIQSKKLQEKRRRFSPRENWRATQRFVWLIQIFPLRRGVIIFEEKAWRSASPQAEDGSISKTT